MNFFVVLLAAGQGSRFSADIPKTFIEFEGNPLWIKPYSLFREQSWVSKVVVTVPKELLNHHSLELLSRNNDLCVVGGSTRRSSVKKALDVLSSSLTDEEKCQSYVLIHDAARAFLSSGLLLRIKEAVIQFQAVTAAIPSTDSLIKVDIKTSEVKESLSRTEIFRVQTPQAFRFDLIEKAHSEFKDEATDDASMVQTIHPVHFVFGDESNRKVTFQGDL